MHGYDLNMSLHNHPASSMCQGCVCFCLVCIFTIGGLSEIKCVMVVTSAFMSVWCVCVCVCACMCVRECVCVLVRVVV